MKVQETKIGNAIIEVYDDCIVGPEEVEKILKKIGSIGNGKRTNPIQENVLAHKSKKKEEKLA
ncbi:hypothetical protein [Clostridium sp. E02]|uniref:hypothetical protein n=1 Tax=Clostridium sp. E02 TaxID=2487134 RepID=UPI000F523767|nr:hypothetical protein [Clostridium sp. E02]